MVLLEPVSVWDILEDSWACDLGLHAMFPCALARSIETTDGDSSRCSAPRAQRAAYMAIAFCQRHCDCVMNFAGCVRTTDGRTVSINFTKRHVWSSIYVVHAESICARCGHAETTKLGLSWLRRSKTHSWVLRAPGVANGSMAVG